MEIEFERIASQLLDKGLAIEDGLFDDDLLVQLHAEAEQAYISGDFEAAEVGKGVAKQQVAELRNDHVKWLHRNTASSAVETYWLFLDQLRDYLSNYFRIHLERTEIHFAVYPKGSFYTKHKDQFRSGGNRIFSVILYLNPNWTPSDGGELRVYSEQDDFFDIAPILGRLVCFRSDQVLHEVLVSNAPRLSITGWMRRDPLIY